MKTILVIDMPETCSRCPCYNDELGFCQASDEDSYLWGGNARPSWCPLKEMPKEMEYEDDWNDIDISFRQGWNACIEEIER